MNGWMKRYVRRGPEQGSFCPTGVWGLAQWHVEVFWFTNLEALPRPFFFLRLHYKDMIDYIIGHGGLHPIYSPFPLPGEQDRNENSKSSFLHAVQNHSFTIKKELIPRVLGVICQNQGWRPNLYHIYHILLPPPDKCSPTSNHQSTSELEALVLISHLCRSGLRLLSPTHSGQVYPNPTGLHSTVQHRWSCAWIMCETQLWHLMAGGLG